MSSLASVFTPNEAVSKRTLWIVGGVWFAIWVSYWALFRPEIFPSPLEVIRSFPDLWWEEGLAQELVTSFKVNVQALAWSSVISLGLAYFSVVAFVRPLVTFVSKLRFVSPAAFLFVLIVATHNGHQLKVSMMTLGITVFFVTTMTGIVAAIPKEKFDHARTLRMSEWRAIWYVVVRGTLDQAIDVLRDNAAMGWVMLTMVEGLVRSEGGVGVLILNQNKHLNLANVYAIATAIILVGLTQDYALGVVKNILCPHAALTLERR